ncbi:hypothetical protein [Radiobacillus sp. PE A8.2]|uniref:hypothetical protein n=1 Tax=Radiobacillus sp. PE A8.2 TaxID=3380349 RepID=UPI00388D8753
MSKERFDRIEDLLTQLISTVATLVTEVKSRKTDLSPMKNDVGSLRTDMDSLKSDVGSQKTDMDSMKYELKSLREDFTNFVLLSEKRHTETLDNFRRIQADQDHILGKSFKNEREIA